MIHRFKHALWPLGLVLLTSTGGCASTPDTPQGPANAEGEVVPANEAAATAFVVNTIKAGVQADFDKTGHAVRDAHPKAHGCVQARFTVLPNLPAKVAQGLFNQPHTYDALIRFSNGAPHVQDDHQRDARGMAIKIKGVPGAKLLDDERDAQTQDFVLTNHPVFFIRNAQEYIGFTQAMSGSTWSQAGWLLSHLFYETPIILAFTGHDITNPLNSPYWSTTPSKLGAEQMKFAARPCAGSSFKGTANGDNMLGDNLKTHLASQSACFDFMVQLRTVPEHMPIEDPTVEWVESESPMIPVAQVQIAPQTVDTGEACEVASFTPWHTLPEHRPLGGISRVRKVVYQQVSILRHQLNKQLRSEP